MRFLAILAPIWLDFGAILDHFGRDLGRISKDFGRIWAPSVLWSAMGHSGGAFGCFWAGWLDFASLLV